MTQLSVILKKDVTINTMVCSPNVILLAKQTTSIKDDGSVNTSVRYIEVCNVKNTDSLTILQSLLKFCVSEFLVASDFEKQYVSCNIKQQKLFNKFLNTNTIHRTNSEGKVTNALVSDIPFNQTALKVKDSHTIANCKKENIKAAILLHAKAILSQCQYLRLIIAQAEKIDKDTAKTPKVVKSKVAKVVKPKVAKVVTPKVEKVVEVA